MDAFSSGPGSSVVHSGPNLHHLADSKQTMFCGDPEEFGYFEDFGSLVVCVLAGGLIGLTVSPGHDGAVIKILR